MVHPSGSLVWFTDGSKTTEGTGAGIHGMQPRKDFSVSLGKYATVFQAEVFAILWCATFISRRPYKDKVVYIYSDSQAGLRALDSCSFTSKLVYECHMALEELGRYNRVKLLWLPGHSGIEGNEAADRHARKASSEPFIGPEPVLPPPWCIAMERYGNWEKAEHKKYWNATPGLRQSKMFIGEELIDAPNSELMALNKNDLRTLIGLYTGHSRLGKHLQTIGVSSDSPMCRLCLEADETAHHILCECDALARLRMEILGNGYPQPDFYHTLPIKDVLRLIKSANIFDE